ncbi:MAG TPA: hypothetical protein VHP11_11275, partial [Tepidisphaeraceae bacterium]|nr:hypothetical protein [Tepidisphaeraceae bacterium]
RVKGERGKGTWQRVEGFGGFVLGCLFLVLNLPLHIVRGLLRLWAMQSHLLSRLHWALIAQSLLYGFTIALLIHWLKRRQMRRL